MKIMLGLLLSLIGYGVFKYSIYNIAELVGMDKKKSLIPGYDIAVLFKYIELPLWTVILFFIPFVNGLFLLYLIIKNPKAFFATIPVVTPIYLYVDVKALKENDEKTLLDKVVNVCAIIVKVAVMLAAAWLFICGGFIIFLIYMWIAKKLGWRLIYWELIREYLFF